MQLRRLLFVAVLGVCTGCLQQQVRSQKADDADRDVDMRTVGDLTMVTNAHSIPVIGVGLVTGLAGTGGGVPPGNERAQLENELKKLNVSNINELFTSKTTSLVNVRAEIPAGARKSDPIDVIVQVPDYCRTTSLRGGKLEICWLYSFENSQNLSSDPSKPARLLRGHAMVKAEGPILTDLPNLESDNEGSLKIGRVWAGGKVQLPDRAFVLEVKTPSVKTAVGIAERVNETFHGPGSSAAPVAVAKNDTHVVLGIPGAYRLNLGRYLRTVMAIPLERTPKLDDPYVKKQIELLRDPGTCYIAAIHLEALGSVSIPALKVALESEFPMVRFCAAEALAYLGSPACAEELAKQVVEHPFVRAYALTALASLNEAACRLKLQELLDADAPEVRYGAFRALRALDEQDALVQGEKIGATFWLHRLMPGGPPQIHASTNRRAEIVLFGESPSISGAVSLVAGPDFVLTANEGEDFCTLTRITLRQGKQIKKCALDVADVLRNLGELNGTYVDALELLRQLHAQRALNCSVKLDALPKAPSVYDLARGSRPGRVADIGPGPTLYDTSDSARSALVAGAP